MVTAQRRRRALDMIRVRSARGWRSSATIRRNSQRAVHAINDRLFADQDLRLVVRRTR
jgi:hypothetical protein